MTDTFTLDEIIDRLADAEAMPVNMASTALIVALKEQIAARRAAGEQQDPCRVAQDAFFAGEITYAEMTRRVTQAQQDYREQKDREDAEARKDWVE